jgi:hypothetical protein
MQYIVCGSSQSLVTKYSASVSILIKRGVKSLTMKEGKGGAGIVFEVAVDED